MKKIHGCVRDLKNQEIGGVTIRAFRGTELYCKTWSSKYKHNEGRYIIELDDCESCIDVVYFSHSSYHPSTMIPLCGIDNSYVNPILLNVKEKIGSTLAMIQITNYDVILTEMARLRDPELAMPEADIQKYKNMIPVLQRKLQAMSDNLLDGFATEVYRARIQRMLEFCSAFDYLTEHELVKKLS